MYFVCASRKNEGVTDIIITITILALCSLLQWVIKANCCLDIYEEVMRK